MSTKMALKRPWNSCPVKPWRRLKECLRADAVHVAHQQRQIGIARLQSQVVVIAHEAVSQNLGVKTLGGLGQNAEKQLPIFIPGANSLASVTA